MLMSVVCTSQYENLHRNGCKFVYDKTEFLLCKPFLKTFMKTISTAENCFSGG